MENLNDSPARYEEHLEYLRDPTSPHSKPYSIKQQMANEAHKRRVTLYKGTERKVFDIDEVDEMTAKGWRDTPNAKVEKPEKPVETPLLEALREEAKKMGIDVDMRWGEKRLKKEMLDASDA